jgi:alanine racemase
MTVSREKWIEIDLDGVKHNVEEIKRHLKSDTLLIAVVKADAYGHGSKEVSRICLENGADWLGVANPIEGENLRRLGFEVPIFVLSPSFPETAGIVVRNKLIQGVDSTEQVRALDYFAEKERKNAIVHIKVDTGLGRFGVLPKDIVEFAQVVSRFRNITLQGVYTHFASPYTDREYTKHQYNKFLEVKKLLQQEKISIEMFHCANSPASMDFRYMHMDAVRIGFSLCNRCIGLEKSKQWNLRDCLKFKTKIVKVRKVGRGEHIGYENRFITDREMEIGIIPVGYADGISTSLANCGYCLIKGTRRPLVGSVGLNQSFVDLTGFAEQVSIGDEVVIIGKQKNALITYREIARHTNSGNAETVLRISGSNRRLFYEKGRVF